MKLQINTKGSWRDVINYESKHDYKVRMHGAWLATYAGAKLRVINDDGSVAAHWDKENGWEEWSGPQ